MDSLWRCFKSGPWLWVRYFYCRYGKVYYNIPWTLVRLIQSRRVFAEGMPADILLRLLRDQSARTECPSPRSRVQGLRWLQPRPNTEPANEKAPQTLNPEPQTKPNSTRRLDSKAPSMRGSFTTLPVQVGVLPQFIGIPNPKTCGGLGHIAQRRRR